MGVSNLMSTFYGYFRMWLSLFCCYVHYVIDGLCFTMLNETPCAEPHAGCCGGWRPCKSDCV